MNPSTNPYAPPELPEERDDFEANSVWRDGDSLVIRNGAAIPPFCFESGKPTQRGVLIKRFWQPVWVNWLILVFILPYFIASPMLGRWVSIRVPISDEVYAQHKQLVNIGYLCLLASLTLIIAAVITNQYMLFLILGGATVVPGLIFASRQPIKLQIQEFTSDRIVLRGVHTDCLRDLPSI